MGYGYGIWYNTNIKYRYVQEYIQIRTRIHALITCNYPTPWELQIGGGWI